MTAVLESRGLGKRYRQRQALTDCTLSVPAGHMVGLVGPNGAGKTTLLNLATGLLAPTTGTIDVLGGVPGTSPAQLAHVCHLSGVPACQAHGDCGTAAGAFMSQVRASTTDKIFYDGGAVVVYAVPALIGVFWGAPLITREIETGTFRLAWNQSVTRTRWLAVKLGLIGPRRADPPHRSRHGRHPRRLHRRADHHNGVGPAAPGHAAARGLGVQHRQPQPADHGIRPGSPMTVTDSVNVPGAWVLSNQTITPSGHVFQGPAPRVCFSGPIQACAGYVGRLHLRQLVTYQPAGRYWAFQWYETAIFLAIALALAGARLWWVRRRRLA